MRFVRWKSIVRNTNNPFKRKIKKSIVSAFVILNVGTIFFVNRTDSSAVAPYFDRFMAKLPSQAAGWITRIERTIDSYAIDTGLDPTWIMFCRPARCSWWYVIKGEYAGSHTVVLPLPFQSQRSFLQKNFFDFREVKFRTNIFNVPGYQLSYSHYLCRQYPANEGSPIKSIVWELYVQPTLSQSEAKMRGYHVAPQSLQMTSWSFPCPSEKN